MKKRHEIAIVSGCVLVLLLALGIALVLVPAFAYVFGALAFLLLGGFQLYLGTYHIQRAKAQGRYVPWWKRPSISYTIGCGCLAAMLLTQQLSSGRVPLLPFLLLAMCLFIYAGILTLVLRTRR